MAHRRKEKDEKKKEMGIPDMNQLVSAGRGEYLAAQSAMGNQSYDRAIEPYLKVISSLMHALNEERASKKQPGAAPKKTAIKA